MTGTIVLAGSALWLGVLVSVSPCPLASNLAAASFLAHRVEHRGWVVLGGLLYSLGRGFTYAVFGILAVSAVGALPAWSRFLQVWTDRAMAGLLIVGGLWLLGWLPLRIPSVSVSGDAARRLERWGLAGTFLLGAFFALALCPVSAGLFFGGLVPLAVRTRSPVLFPVIFGLGTGLPVAALAIVAAHAIGRLNDLFLRIARIEAVARRVTGAVLALVGAWLVSKQLVTEAVAR